MSTSLYKDFFKNTDPHLIIKMVDQLVKNGYPDKNFLILEKTIALSKTKMYDFFLTNLKKA